MTEPTQTGHASVEATAPGEITVVFDNGSGEICHAKLTYTPTHFPPTLIVDALAAAAKDDVFSRFAFKAKP